MVWARHTAPEPQGRRSRTNARGRKRKQKQHLLAPSHCAGAACWRSRHPWRTFARSLAPSALFQRRRGGLACPRGARRRHRGPALASAASSCPCGASPRAAAPRRGGAWPPGRLKWPPWLEGAPCAGGARPLRRHARARARRYVKQSSRALSLALESLWRPMTIRLSANATRLVVAWVLARISSTEKAASRI